MIRVYYNRGQGFVSITSTGHADPKICAAVGALMYAAANGLQLLALNSPREISFESMEHTKPSTSFLPTKRVKL
jgi:hypothetical protein